MRTRCRFCGAEIETDLGCDPPNEHEGALGTKDDPAPPGDWDNVCADCCYVHGMQGSQLTADDIVWDSTTTNQEES